MNEPPPPARDPVADALHFVRVTGTFYCRSELTAPWGLSMPPMDGCVWFHALLAGQCRLEVEGHPDLVLEAGSFTLVPHGRGHRLRSARRVASPNVIELPHEVVSDRYALLRHGGGGAATSLVCGVVRLDAPTGRELERALPAAIHVAPSSLPDADWMNATLRLMAAETRSVRPGGETVVTRLSDVLVIHAIRAWLAEDEGARRGWIGGLRDPQIGRALAAVWRAPAEPWSVSTLAARAGMSRSVFAARFVELLGEAPMQHVTRVRMQTASEALTRPDATLGGVASALGYASLAAFSRAFKRTMGRTPGAVRRAHA